MFSLYSWEENCLMKKKLLGIFLVMAAAVALTAPSAMANALGNPGFEDPVVEGDPPFLGRWQPFAGGGATSVRDTVDPMSGVGHMSLTINNANNTFAGIFQDVAVTAGQMVDFNLYHKTTSLPYNLVTEMRIEWRDATTEVGRTPNLMTPPTDSYSLLSLSAAAPANATLARVVYAIQSFTNDNLPDIGTVYLDNGTTTVVPEPTTLALIGMSVAGLTGLRRRS
jgi:hypothetical protein